MRASDHPPGKALTPVSTRPEQGRHGRFAPGVSGNPRGRPPGCRHTAYTALEAVGQKAVNDIPGAVIRKAKAVGIRAAQVVLDRCRPSPKGRAVSVALPAITTAADLGLAHDAIVAALAEARITVEEAGQLAALLELRRETVEAVDLERRLSELERRHKR